MAMDAADMFPPDPSAVDGNTASADAEIEEVAEPVVAVRERSRVVRVRCGGCGANAAYDRPLRRGRCPGCYDDWVKQRPVGVGAGCSGCGDRRKMHLRYYEMQSKERVAGGRWIVLCHNCTSVAEHLKPSPRSVEGLKMRLQRDRRWGDRRAAAVGRVSERKKGSERRDNDRRSGLRDLFDATDIAEELVIEMEAEYEEAGLYAASPQNPEDITGIHYKPSLEEITQITMMPQAPPPASGKPDVSVDDHEVADSIAAAVIAAAIASEI